MAFESLTDKFSSIIKKLKGETYLTEKNMDEMLKSIRLALLDADVNYKVVKEFVNNVKEKSIGQEVLKKVNPSQMITKIVHDELIELLGSNDIAAYSGLLSVYNTKGLSASSCISVIATT